MSTSTYKEMQDRVLSTLGTSETADRDLVKTYLNEALEDAWRAHGWWERKKWGWVNCVAPYSTGTVVTTKASATVTGTGTVFPTASATRPYKFASGYAEPWYEIYTRGGDTSLTLDRVWSSTSLAASGYVIYDDRVSLASDVETLLTNEIWMANTAIGQMFRMQHIVEAEQPWPLGSGLPWWFIRTENDSSGNARIRLGPHAPDDIYAIRYAYWKTITALSGDSDTSELPEPLVKAAIEGALSRAYKEEPWRDTDLSERSESAFNRMLAKEIQKAKEEYPNTVRFRTYDARPGSGSTFTYTLPST